MEQYGSLIMIVAMIAVMYFLMIRPENKRKKEAQAMRESLKKGDVIRVVTPGAGGYGDPMKRPAEKVLKDVIERKVSVKAAQEEYGVVILAEGVGYRVDEQATAELRERVARK